MSAEIESKSSVNLELTKLLNEKLSKNIENISFASNELDELNINYDFENFEIMRKHFIYSIEQIFISQSLVNKIISEIKYNLSEFEWMDE